MYLKSLRNALDRFQIPPDGWSRTTIDAKCVLARENRGTFLAVYIAQVRITVQANGATIIREALGTGEGRGTSPGEVHDIALKAAETDATKRALATFGKPFGLALYGSGKTAPSPRVSLPELEASDQSRQSVRLPPDDTTPIPRPSIYYGRRQDLVTRERAQGRRELQIQSTAETSIVPASPGLVPGQIDKSVLTIAEPKRLRDKAHLRFVASQPCRVCGRQPSDPHHLRFPGQIDKSVLAIVEPKRLRDKAHLKFTPAQMSCAAFFVGEEIVNQFLPNIFAVSDSLIMSSK